MAILWCGGEDIDFPNGAPLYVSTNSIYRRTAYCRCALQSLSSGQSSVTTSTPFDGGAVTSCWATFRVGLASYHSSVMFFGLASFGTSKGLSVGCDSTGRKISLWKTDGTTATLLASESGSSLVTGTPQRIDFHIENYGASATVTVFCDGAQVTSYTGNAAVSGVTALDCAALWGGNGLPSYANISEIIVADEDTRLMSLCTLAPSAAGDANTWTGAYTDISEVTLSDATEIYTDTVAQDAQFNVTDLPSGSLTVKAVKVAARVAKSTGATVGSVCLGIKSGGTVDTGSPIACDTAWTTKERLMAQNPVTANIWQISEINALQLNFRSAS